MNRLGKMLKLYRASEGMEQQKLADEIGVGKSTLSRIEKGKMTDIQGGIKIMAWLFNNGEPKGEGQ